MCNKFLYIVQIVTDYNNYGFGPSDFVLIMWMRKNLFRIFLLRVAYSINHCQSIKSIAKDYNILL